MQISNSVIIHTSFRFKQNELKLSLSSVIVTRVNCITICLNSGSKNRSLVKKEDKPIRKTGVWIPILVISFAVLIHFIIYSSWIAYWYDIQNRIIKKIVNSVLNTHHKLILTSYPLSYYSISYETIAKIQSQMLHFFKSAGNEFTGRIYRATLLELATICLTSL